MHVTTFVLGPLDTNCYVLSSDNLAIIIDPAGEGDFLSDYILSNSLTLTHILLTHAHYDHLLGTLPLKLNFNPDICLSKKDLFLYQKAIESYSHFHDLTADPLPSPDVFLMGGEGIELHNRRIEVIETPGHTPGSLCFYEKYSGCLFTGDTLFKGAVGRTDLSYSSRERLEQSINIIEQLPNDTLIYPGHGEVTTISNEFS